MNINPIHAFILPNGSNLSYAWPQDAMGGQFKWKHSYLTERLKTFRANKKERQLRIGLWTSRTDLHLVCADFDTLPKGFEDWDCFFDFCKVHYPDGFIYRSFNQKIKILFLGKLDDGKRINTAFATNFLKARIGHEFFEYVDLNSSAISTSFISSHHVEKLRNWLPTARVFQIETDIELHNFYLFEGDLPDQLNEFIKAGGKSQVNGREKFVRILLKMGKLVKDGFDLPITKLGKECGVQHSRISEWRYELMELGLLARTNEDYCKGFKGMTYRARGILRKLIYQMSKVTSKTVKIAYSDLPVAIKDGYWEQTIWQFSKYFVGNPEAFIKWGLTISGVRKKRRFKKLYRAINSRLKYLKLPKILVPRTV